MIIGIDVSKDTLVCCSRDGKPFSVSNSQKGVKQLLCRLQSGATVAMEATGRYHRLLANTAHSMGFLVYVFNPKDVNRYAKSVSPRAATDPIAAGIIAEFASIRKHRPYSPLPAFVDVLKDLVRTRAGLVKQRVSLSNQAGEHGEIATCLKQAMASIAESIKKLDERIVSQAKSRPEYDLLIKIPGFGPLVCSYMIAMLSSGTFARSDSFVAFIGLDLRVRESGKFKGRRKLSKRGDPEARRLLYLAAFAASRHAGPFAQLKQHYLDCGFSPTEATVFIARKLARVAWSIYTHHQAYTPDRVLSQPTSKTKAADHTTTIQTSYSHVVAQPQSSRVRFQKQNSLQKGVLLLDKTT